MITNLPSEMIEKYVSRRELDLEQIKKNLIEGRVEDFNRIGHQLRGNARTFGFTNLDEISNQMEKLNLENLANLGPKIITELARWIFIEKNHFSL